MEFITCIRDILAKALLELDVSAWKVMNNYVRKRQITNEYTLHKGKNGVPKKLVINKKLRKADKKWIKKFAKKWHVKVVEK